MIRVRFRRLYWFVHHIVSVSRHTARSAIPASAIRSPVKIPGFSRKIDSQIAAGVSMAVSGSLAHVCVLRFMTVNTVLPICASPFAPFAERIAPFDEQFAPFTSRGSVAICPF